MFYDSGKVVKLALPKIHATVTLTRIDESQMVPETSLEQVRLDTVDLGGRHIGNLSLDESVLEKVLLLEAKLDKISLLDVVMKSCDLSAAKCSESSMIRARFDGGRLIGVDLSRSTLKDVIFEDCNLNMANFRSAKLMRVHFINCTMHETDFQMAELRDVAFQASSLEKVEFAHCKLRNVDARSSRLFDIRGWQSLHGLIIDPVQLTEIAPQLAVELGLLIKE